MKAMPSKASLRASKVSVAIHKPFWIACLREAGASLRRRQATPLPAARDDGKRLLIFLVLLFSLLFPAPLMAAETVVILHGIARSAANMKPVEDALKTAGFETLNIQYPSQKMNLNGIANWLDKNRLTTQFWEDAEKVHFVTHSMGGLTARRYLATYKDTIPEEKLGRVVMLAPPNKGSEVADFLIHLPPYGWYYGPAGAELTTGTQEAIFEEPYYELGIIAGTREWTYPLAAFIIPGKSDGRVSVERSKLPGMKDHVTLPATHTFIMKKKEVHELIIHFLRDGKFDANKN